MGEFTCELALLTGIISKQTLTNLVPLPRVFQIVLTDRGVRDLPGWILLLGGRNLTTSGFGN